MRRNTPTYAHTRIRAGSDPIFLTTFFRVHVWHVCTRVNNTIYTYILTRYLYIYITCTFIWTDDPMSRWERHCFPPKAQPIHMWAHTSHTRTPRRYYYILCALFASDWKRVHRRRYRVFSGGTGCLAATGARDDMVLSTDGNSSAGWARVIFIIVQRPVYDDDDAFNIKLLLFRSTYLAVFAAFIYYA